MPERESEDIVPEKGRAHTINTSYISYPAKKGEEGEVVVVNHSSI